MSDKNLLEKRAQIKSKKPRFIVQDAHKRGELHARWRKPRGVDSKMRLGKKGHRKKPSQGYRSPKLVRGRNKTGLKMVRACSLKDLENLPKDVGLIVSSRVGNKKRFEIIKKAQELKIKVINIDAEKFLKNVEKERAEKAEKKKEKKIEKKTVEKKKPAEKEKKKQEVKQEKKEEEKELTEKEKKDAEKKERDKLLTKRVR